MSDEQSKEFSFEKNVENKKQSKKRPAYAPNYGKRSDESINTDFLRESKQKIDTGTDALLNNFKELKTELKEFSDNLKEIGKISRIFSDTMSDVINDLGIFKKQSKQKKQIIDDIFSRKDTEKLKRRIKNWEYEFDYFTDGIKKERTKWLNELVGFRRGLIKTFDDTTHLLLGGLFGPIHAVMDEIGGWEFLFKSVSKGFKNFRIITSGYNKVSNKLDKKNENKHNDTISISEGIQQDKIKEENVKPVKDNLLTNIFSTFKRIEENVKPVKDNLLTNIFSVLKKKEYDTKSENNSLLNIISISNIIKDIYKDSIKDIFRSIKIPNIKQILTDGLQHLKVLNILSKRNTDVSIGKATIEGDTILKKEEKESNKKGILSNVYGLFTGKNSIINRISTFVGGLFAGGFLKNLFRLQFLKSFTKIGGIGAFAFDAIGAYLKDGIGGAIKSLFIGSGEKSISNILSGVAKGAFIGSFFGPIGTAIGAALGGLSHYFAPEINSFLDNIKTSVKSFANDLLGVDLKSGLNNIISSFSSFFKDIQQKGTNIISWLSEKFSSLSDVVAKLIYPFQILYDGISALASKLFGWVKGDTVKDIYKHSKNIAITGLTKAKEIGYTAVNYIKKSLGWLSSKFESGGNISAIAPNDIGGSAYGKWQIHSKSMPEFLNLLDKKYPEIAKEFSGITVGTKEFNAKWKEVSKKMPDQFEQAQREFFANRLSKTISPAKELGFNTQSDAIKEVLGSLAIQHSEKGWKQILTSASNAAQGDISKLSDIDQIKLIYNARRDYVKSVLSGKNELQGVLDRYSKEENDVLNAYFKDKATSQPQENFAKPRIAPVEEDIFIPASQIQEQNSSIFALQNQKKSILEKDVEAKKAERSIEVNVPQMQQSIPILPSSEGVDMDKIPVSVDDFSVLLVQLGLV